MADDVANEVIREIDQEKADRGNFESLWTQTARRVHPRGDNFLGRNVTPGERRSEWQFDSRPVVGNERYAAVLYSMTMPPSEYYHGFRAEERSIRKDIEVKQWCEETRDDCFQMRYSGASNFVGQINEVLLSHGAFGTGLMFLDDPAGRAPVYKSLDLAKTWIREGEGGKVNYFIRQLDLRPHQAIEKFGANQLPTQILTAATTQPNKTFEFYHRVKPRALINKNLRFSFESMGWQSDYVCQLERKHMETGGYRTFPLAVARNVTTTGEVYGRGPAMTVLADIKMKNEMWRTILRASHRMAEPAMLLADDAALAPFQMQPGFRNKGYIKQDGTLLAQQLPFEGDLNAALSVAAATDEVIKDAFLMRVWEMMLTNPNMTATEVLERLRERGMLLTPSAGRFFGEFVCGLVERELDILQARGRLAQMPERLVKYRGRVEVTDNSPLARAQKAERAIGFDRTVQQVTPLAQVNPRIMQRFKTEEILPELAEIHGMPINWLYTDEEFAEIMTQQDQRQAAEQAVVAAPALADAAQKAAQARLLTQQAGGMIQ